MKNLPVKDIPKEITIKDEWIQKRDEILAESQAIEVADQDSYTKAEECLKKVTSHSNQLENKRKDLARPFNDMAKKIKKLADDERADLEKEKTRLKKDMAKYYAEQEAKRRAEEEAAARLAAKQAEDDPFGANEALSLTPATDRVRKTGSSARTVYDFEITNPNLVPREFCSPDPVKIRAHITAHKAAAQIDGVKITKTTKIQSR